MKQTTVYENDGGILSVIVKDDGNVVNVIAGFEDGMLPYEEFINSARYGFEYADDYDPDAFSGLSMESAAAEIENADELIAEITQEQITIYTKRMGYAGNNLFRIKEAI